MIKIKTTKKIPSVKVKKTIGNQKRGLWYNGKFFVPLSSIGKTWRNKIVSAIQLGNSNKFFYTLDKKRRVKGFAPKNLL